jgi:hypothetical protein
MLDERRPFATVGVVAFNERTLRQNRPNAAR